MTRDAILTALQVWINQRPGLDPRNYGSSWQAYRQESRNITRQKHDAQRLLDAVRWHESIGVDELKQAFRAFSGRLSLEETPKGFRLSYCTGQYWPTEYRAAAAAVLASALWEYYRSIMPPSSGKLTRTHGPFTTDHDNIEGLTPGDWLRRKARQDFGRHLQERWFN